MDLRAYQAACRAVAVLWLAGDVFTVRLRADGSGVTLPWQSVHGTWCADAPGGVSLLFSPVSVSLTRYTSTYCWSHGLDETGLVENVDGEEACSG